MVVADSVNVVLVLLLLLVVVVAAYSQLGGDSNDGDIDDNYDPDLWTIKAVLQS